VSAANAAPKRSIFFIASPPNGHKQDETSISSADARGTVTQRKDNRNLSKRLPKRFGYSDLAIESSGSQGVSSLIDLNPEGLDKESALQHGFLALQQQFCFKPRRSTSKLIRLGDFANNHRIDSN